MKSTSYAVFGQADWLVTDALTLTFGGRWIQEEKEAYVNRPIMNLSRDGDTESWGNFSPMFVASYAFTDDLTTYAKISQGWRSGGFNGEVATEEIAKTPYKEETTTAYEIGMKAQWWDGRIQTNVAAFQNDTKDMQLSNYDQTTGYSIIENAGQAVVRGFELELLHAITNDLTAFFNYGYMHSKYTDFKVSGVQMKNTASFAYAPENKFSVGMDYITDLSFAELRLNGAYSFTDDQVFYRQEYSANVTASPSYGLFNARIALAGIAVSGDQTLDVGLWGKNLTAEAYRVNGIPAQGSSAVNYYGDPRTFGADITYTF